MKALIDIRRPERTPWSGRLPRPRKSPAVTLGDCVVKVRHGKRQVTKGTIAEILRSSPSPVSLEVSRLSGDQFRIQIPRDPISTMQDRSELATGDCGPADRATCGPCVPIRIGRSRCRGGKLAARFLLPTCDIETLNKRTLTATPYSFSPSYAQALRTGMAAAGPGGAGNIGANNNGGAAGAGQEDLELVAEEDVQAEDVVCVVVVKITVPGMTTTTATTTAHTTMDSGSTPISGLIHQITGPDGSMSGEEEVHMDVMELAGGMGVTDRFTISSGSGCRLKSLRSNGGHLGNMYRHSSRCTKRHHQQHIQP